MNVRSSAKSSHVRFGNPQPLEISKLWNQKLFQYVIGPRSRARSTYVSIVALFDSHHNYLLCFVLEILLGGKQRKQSVHTERLVES